MIQILRVPQIVFIDRKGVIRQQRGGGSDPDFFNNEENIIRTEVEKLLTEPGAPKTVSAAHKK
jgi:hypothetical protein